MTTYSQWISIVVGLIWSALAVADNYQNHPQAQHFIDTMVANQGFERGYLQQLMAQAERKDAILVVISRPAEKTKAWKDYRNIFITERRIREGREFMRAHAKTLARAEQQFGVPANIITAIIGVETYYGGNKGSYRVLDALATLAFDYPPRSTFFSKELEQYLLLIDEMGFDPLAVKGSYAGAMGYGQFIPSSYRHYAVDFAGDGVVDLMNNPDDAIGSVANYLSVHGWRRGEPVVMPVSITDDCDGSLADNEVNLRYTVGQLRQAGYAPAKAFAGMLGNDTKATMLALQGERGIEYWMGLQNFYVLTRYNRSHLYAMAVTELSESFAPPE